MSIYTIQISLVQRNLVFCLKLLSQCNSLFSLSIPESFFLFSFFLNNASSSSSSLPIFVSFLVLQTFYQIRRIPGHWEEKCLCTSGLTVNLVSNPNVTVANYSKKLYSPPSSTHKEPTVYGPVIKLFKCFFFFLNGGSFNH